MLSLLGFGDEGIDVCNERISDYWFINLCCWRVFKEYMCIDKVMDMSVLLYTCPFPYAMIQLYITLSIILSILKLSGFK